jgi:four helix bundle protein
MSENQTTIRTVNKIAANLFDHEKLDVYHLQLKFIAWVTPLLEEVSHYIAGSTAEVRNQLERASLSLLLNTAEGNGKRQRQVRAKFFDDARGSATECAACLDALVAKNVATEDRIIEGKKMLLRIVSMLCGLIDRFDSPMALRDGPVGCQMEGEPAKQIVSYCSKNRGRGRKRGRG